jgi:hypothetical protein
MANGKEATSGKQQPASRSAGRSNRKNTRVRGLFIFAIRDCPLPFPL